jgi:hypothetical protein
VEAVAMGVSDDVRFRTIGLKDRLSLAHGRRSFVRRHVDDEQDQSGLVRYVHLPILIGPEFSGVLFEEIAYPLCGFDPDFVHPL